MSGRLPGEGLDGHFRLPVLMYHAVTRIDGRFRNLGVEPGVFQQQIAALLAAGYQLVGLTEALQLVADGTRNVVALTFDDAYRDFLGSALPALRETGSRATLYVPTGHIGGEARWLGDRRREMPALLSMSELHECAASGHVEIGSHSHTHSQLDIVPPAALHKEISESRALLEESLQVPVQSFCYPHGYHRQAVRSRVRLAGYDNACEVGRRLRSIEHRFSISRLAVSPNHDGARIVAELRSGGPVAIPTVKRGLQPTAREFRRVRAAIRSHE